MRSEIRRIQQETGITAVLVTHDQVEAMSMCDRIAIMNDGKIVQIARPMEMYNNPASDFVAGFLGNPPIAFVDGIVRDGRFEAASASGAMSVQMPFHEGARERKIRLGVRPEYFRPGGSQPVSGSVTFVEAQGRETLYDVALDDGQILRSIQNSTDTASVGDRVTWGVDVEKILMFDEQGLRL